jgi:hypothetical protein
VREGGREREKVGSDDVCVLARARACVFSRARVRACVRALVSECVSVFVCESIHRQTQTDGQTGRQEGR